MSRRIKKNAYYKQEITIIRLNIMTGLKTKKNGMDKCAKRKEKYIEKTSKIHIKRVDKFS